MYGGVAAHTTSTKLAVALTYVRRMSAASRARSAFVKIADGNVHYSWNPARKSAAYPPLVCIGGTSQVLSSWVSHVRALSLRRDLLIYETRGQGRTALPLEDCSLEAHVRDFVGVLDAMNISSHVDVCGFSFGGRVAMAIAALVPERIRRCVVTGVPAERTASGRDILRSWQKSLRNDRLEAFVWQTVSQGHSDLFLRTHESKLAEWVESSVRSNRAEAIAAIVEQTHHDDPLHPFHTMNLAKTCRDVDMLLISGEDDRIAESHEVLRLADLGEWPCAMIEGAGHAVLIERPVLWRSNVLDFLDAD